MALDDICYTECPHKKDTYCKLMAIELEEICGTGYTQRPDKCEYDRNLYEKYICNKYMRSE